MGNILSRCLFALSHFLHVKIHIWSSRIQTAFYHQHLICYFYIQSESSLTSTTICYQMHFFTTDFIIIFPKLNYSYNHIMAIIIIKFTYTCTLFVNMWAIVFKFYIMYLRSKTIIIASIVICIYVSNIKKWRLK